MATAFPGAIDTFTNPSSGQFQNSPSHSQQHDNINDAMAAVQAKVGATGSAVTTSLTYKLGGVTGTDLAVSKTGAETLTNKTLTTPIIAQILNSGTLSLPTSTDTLVGRATTDTMTNKTLTSPKIGTSILDTNGALLITVSATASAVNGISIINSATGVDPQILPGGTDSTRNLNLRGKGTGKTVTIGAGGLAIFLYDFVASGCAVTADSAGVNKNYSMTSGVIVINGNPVTIASVAAQTVGASKDRYIDYSDNGDGTGLITTTEVANNAASPALAANSVRVAIVPAGATTIATAADVNQGQEGKLLPIASSIPYGVSDSLGNLICPRDPQRRLLCLRGPSADFSTSATSPTQITAMSCPVIVPTGRKIKAYIVVWAMYGAVGVQNRVGIWDGTVGSGTLKNMGATNVASQSLTYSGIPVEAYDTPTATSKTYNGAAHNNSAGTMTIESGIPAAAGKGTAYMRVELE